MKKYRIKWLENHDGDHAFATKVVEAESEDAACDIWERDIKPYVNTSDIWDCEEVYDTPLFEKMLYLDMPDGRTYVLPVEVIARHRANHYAGSKFNNSFSDSLTNDTIPLFLNSDFEIVDWAQNNMNWADVKDRTFIAERKPPAECKFQEAWVNGDPKVA